VYRGKGSDSRNYWGDKPACGLFKLDSKQGSIEQVLGLSIAERMDGLKVDK